MKRSPSVGFGIGIRQNHYHIVRSKIDEFHCSIEFISFLYGVKPLWAVFSVSDSIQIVKLNHSDTVAVDICEHKTTPRDEYITGNHSDTILTSI